MRRESDIQNIIAEILNIHRNEVTDISMLKKGMTNKSVLFSLHGKRYIMRIPGEGTDRLISRTKEYAVYQAMKGKGICDEVIYINPKNGYKITKFLEGARVCDARNMDDVKKCMKKLREFHEMGLKVPHEFDLFGQILFYESLRKDHPSEYSDYEETKERVFSLKPYIEAYSGRKILSHIDAVPDNFLFVKKDIRLIDWEYAGMQDPHIDLAMFCVYSFYHRSQVDSLIDMYFPEGCSKAIRVKIYCYIAACGLLWSNWCEYKKKLGIAFGEYALWQYHYAKEYYKIAKQELEK